MSLDGRLIGSMPFFSESETSLRTARVNCSATCKLRDILTVYEGLPANSEEATTGVVVRCDGSY